MFVCVWYFSLVVWYLVPFWCTFYVNLRLYKPQSVERWNFCCGWYLVVFVLQAEAQLFCSCGMWGLGVFGVYPLMCSFNQVAFDFIFSFLFISYLCVCFSVFVNYLIGTSPEWLRWNALCVGGKCQVIQDTLGPNTVHLLLMATIARRSRLYIFMYQYNLFCFPTTTIAHFSPPPIKPHIFLRTFCCLFCFCYCSCGKWGLLWFVFLVCTLTINTQVQQCY